MLQARICSAVRIAGSYAVAGCDTNVMCGKCIIEFCPYPFRGFNCSSPPQRCGYLQNRILLISDVGSTLPIHGMAAVRREVKSSLIFEDFAKAAGVRVVPAVLSRSNIGSVFQTLLLAKLKFSDCTKKLDLRGWRGLNYPNLEVCTWINANPMTVELLRLLNKSLYSSRFSKHRILVPRITILLFEDLLLLQS